MNFYQVIPEQKHGIIDILKTACVPKQNNKIANGISDYHLQYVFSNYDVNLNTLTPGRSTFQIERAFVIGETKDQFENL